MEHKLNITKQKPAKIKLRIEPELYFGYGHYDEEGKYVKDFEQKAKCFTYNFLSALAAKMAYNTGRNRVRCCQNITRLYDSWYGGTTNAIQRMLCVDYTEDTYRWRNYDIGIILGKGNRPTKLQDWTLEDRIIGGSETEQLVYSSQVMDNPITDHVSSGGYYGWAMTRTMTNNSGADIDIQEAGLFSGLTYDNYLPGDDGERYRTLLLARDVYPSPITIANTNNQTFHYEIRLPKNGSDWVLVKQFLEIIKDGMRNNEPNAEHFRLIGGNGDSDGILISTDTTDVASDEGSVSNQIVHGNDTGEMFHLPGWSVGEYGNSNPDISSIDSLADADDCGADDTADWTKSNCALTYGASIYEMDADANGDMYIEKTITGLEVGRSYAPVVTFNKAVDSNHKAVNVVVRNDTDTGDLETGTTVTSTTSDQECMAIFTATATSHKIRIKVASAVISEVFNISEIDVRLSEAWIKFFRMFYNDSEASIDVGKVYLCEYYNNNVIGAKKLPSVQTVAHGEALLVETEIGVKVT